MAVLMPHFRRALYAGHLLRSAIYCARAKLMLLFIRGHNCLGGAGHEGPLRATGAPT